ncbi:D-alanine--D-alanine ligase [Paenibacillus plantiphilus]|uniref:D-alanine--D-alanine ligase n=2 Tax=Paenibacillus plantiphilus TaxID=2905650 RepID=A0ABM9CT58_9BACL|nr:D-alanine--D-alanine ligase [Paenibacillus plantiphilus]
MGGDSSERQVSLMTGQEMLSHLDRDKYDPYPIEINNGSELVEAIRDVDVALLALHGKYGEDGTIQATLHSLGIPFTGSGVLSSGLCMDKDIAKKLIRLEGIHTPNWMMVDSRMAELDGKALAGKVREGLEYPVVVKPNSGGSSIGVQIIHSGEELQSALQEALRWDDSVMIEHYIGGQEITCAILNGRMLPVLSIASSSDFFDYTSKYTDGMADEQVIHLPPEIEERVRAAALGCWHALKCSVYARIDMILRDGIPYVMEANTLPGLTSASLLPKSAKAAGISMSELLDSIIEHSLLERRRERGS